MTDKIKVLDFSKDTKYVTYKIYLIDGSSFKITGSHMDLYENVCVFYDFNEKITDIINLTQLRRIEVSYEP